MRFSLHIRRIKLFILRAFKFYMKSLYRSYQSLETQDLLTSTYIVKSGLYGL